MQKLSQINAVFTIVINFLTERAIAFDASMQKANELLTTSDRKLLTTQLMQMARDGVFDIASRDYELSDDKPLRKYCDGLLRNHLRRDPRLGGTKQKRGESSKADAKLLALQAIAERATNDDDRAAIAEAIEQRKAELQPTIDAELLPEHLRHLAS